VEAVDLDLPKPVLALAQFHIRLAHQPEGFVRGALLLQILGQQVSIHLYLQQRDAGPVYLVDVLGRLRVEGESTEQDELRRWTKCLSLVQREFHLPLLERRVLRAKT